MKITKEIIYLFSLPFILIILWYVIYKQGIFPEVVFPSPLSVLISLIEGFKSGDLFVHIFASLRRVAIGYTISVSIAIPIGLIVGWFPKMEQLSSFTVTLLRQIPGLAWIPLAMLWLGIGDTACMFILTVAAFFPALLNTILGVREVDPNLTKAALTLGAKPDSWFLFKEVIFPGALPAIMAGLRISLVASWMAIIAGEMAAGTSGLGYMILLQRRLLGGDKVIVGMILIALLGFVMERVLKFLERNLLRWRIGLKE